MTWRSLSAADGHPAEGFLSFDDRCRDSNAAGGVRTGMTHTDADPIDVIGRWLTYLGLLLAVGRAHRGRRRAPIRAETVTTGHGRSASACWWPAARRWCSPLRDGLEAGSVVDYLLATRNGLLLQLARGLVALVGGALSPPRAGVVGEDAVRSPSPSAWWASACWSRLATLPPCRAPVPVLVQAAHVVTAGIWAGGVALLLAVLVRPTLVAGPDGVPAMRALVPRFSALALVSVGIVGPTGVPTAWSQTGVLV